MAQSLMVTYDSRVKWCEILKQWYKREMNFYKDKLRIFIAFRRNDHFGYSTPPDGWAERRLKEERLRRRQWRKMV
jgi:hypothetical protein